MTVEEKTRTSNAVYDLVSVIYHTLSAGPDLPRHRVLNVPGHVS